MSSNPLSDAAEKKTHRHGAAREAADAAAEEEETVRSNVKVQTSEALILIATGRLMLRRLARLNL